MPDSLSKAIFLSYARDDATAARRIAEALRSSGLEVWFDENELRGGDAWDRKIRQQINDCALFVALISQHTEQREKGYFRFEWKLAVDQTAMLAEGVPFITPVVIDETRDAGAVVPPEFMRVQWTRLPGALPTPQFVEQVQRLLHAPHKVGGASRPAAVSGTSPSAGDRRTPIGVWIGAGVAVVIGAVVAIFWSGKQQPTSTAKAASPAGALHPPAVPMPTVPVSEASQLVAKARALYEPWDLATEEDWELAEQLLKKAVELDPADAEAWATYAILTCGSIVSRGANTEVRRAAARSQADRAFKLAPHSNAARFARAFSLRFDRNTQDESLRLLREEAARQPGNRMILRILATTLSALGQHEQALVYLDRAAALPGRDPIVFHNRGQFLGRLGRWVEAEAAIDEALALAPGFSSALSQKLTYLLDYHGDLAAAREALAKASPQFFSRDGGVAQAALIWLYAREPMKCLEVLRPAREYLRAGAFAGFIGPKAYLAGLAHRSLGNAEAAQTEWYTALRIVERGLEAQPNDDALLGNRALVLATLGRRAEVEPVLRELTQRMASGEWLRAAPGVANSQGAAVVISPFDVARVQAVLGKQDEAMATLDSYLKSAIGDSLLNRRNQLRYHPEWDSLRGNPRFEALLQPAAQKR